MDEINERSSCGNGAPALPLFQCLIQPGVNKGYLGGPSKQCEYQVWGKKKRKEKKERKKKHAVTSCLVVTFSTKREIRKFCVVVRARSAKKSVQKSVMHVQSCCLINLMPFCCSLWHRRRCLSSLFCKEREDSQTARFTLDLSLRYWA